MLSRILSLESLKLFMPSSAPEKGELTRTLEGDEGREQEGGDAMEGREKEGDTNGWLAPDTHEKHQPTQEELLAKETVKTFSAISSRDGEGKKLNQYVLIKTLGKGSYSKVKLCINTEDNELYAMKICVKKLLLRKRRGRSSALDDVLAEIVLLSRLRHPNIVLLHEVINDPQQDYIYMVFEYLDGGPLMEGKLENTPLDEETARSYFKDAISGVEYLHKNNVIHGDLKPENMLCTLDRRVKLVDFGNARSFGDTDSFVGTPAFMPPELCYGKISGAMPSRDIWALGVCLYCFMFGRVPFIDHTLIDVYNKIKNDPVVFPSEIDADCADLIQQMLIKEPSERITLSDVKKHPWLTKNSELRPPQED